MFELFFSVFVPVVAVVIGSSIPRGWTTLDSSLAFSNEAWLLLFPVYWPCVFVRRLFDS